MNSFEKLSSIKITTLSGLNTAVSADTCKGVNTLFNAISVE
jgi:hypothetical protein